MANIHTPASQVLAKHSFSVAITAAVTNGTGVDCRGFRNAMAVYYAAPSGSGTTSDCKVQESSDNGGGDAFADVASATFAQNTTAGGAKLQVMNINIAKRERYLRLVHTGAGASAAGQAYGLLLLFNAFYADVSQDQTVITV